MSVKECLEGSETLLSVHITKCMSWWENLSTMLLLPLKDAEAYVSLVLWHLYVFKDMQSPSFRESFSALQTISKSQNMWTCGCLPVPGRQGIFPQFLSVTTNHVLPLMKALVYFTKWFSTPDNHTTLPAMQIIQCRAPFPKTCTRGNVISKPDFVQLKRNTCHWLFPSLNISACKVFSVTLPSDVRNNKEQEEGTKTLARPHLFFRSM